MKNKKRLTNTQVVKQIMETGSPLNQLFVIDALSKWSDHITKNDKKVIDQMNNTMINGQAWVDAAWHCKNILDKHYATR